MKWTAHVEGGPRRVNHAAVCIGDKIYSFGGYCSSDDYKDWEPIPVHVLDTNTLRWSPVKYLKNDLVPFQRYGHTTVAYGHVVYMWGGRNNAVACEGLSCFDTIKLEWSSPSVTGMVPSGRDGHSACVIKNKMYVYGGFEYVSDQYCQQVFYLNFDTLEWTRMDVKGIPPFHRDFHTAVAFGDRMYIFGGRGDMNSPYVSKEEIYCPQVYYLDIVTETWVTVNPTGTWPEGRRSHSAWLYNDSMYIFGGYNNNTKTHFNDVYKYSIKENHWHYINIKGNVPSVRRRQVCLAYKDKVYLFGGTSPCPHIHKIEYDKNEILLDNNDLYVLDYAPSLKTLSILSVLEHKIDPSTLPRDILLDIRTMTLPNRITKTG